MYVSLAQPDANDSVDDVWIERSGEADPMVWIRLGRSVSMRLTVSTASLLNLELARVLADFPAF